jgi:hypothetical protein
MHMIAASEPAGGAALDQVIIATAGALLVTAVLLTLVIGHRSGRVATLGRLGAFASHVSGLPPWTALPSALAGASLFTALLGMYWDISLHIDQGRDAGPLANPAHYLILAGLFGVFSAGVLAIAMPKAGARPGPAAVKIGRDWYAPIGGVLMAACGAFALAGFPLDDMWHRMFGQDVTLWGPTHLMLIGGAGMTLIANAVLLAEGMSERGRRSQPSFVTAVRRASIVGGLLIGLSTFQAEFDFGVPQYRLVFQPFLIALAAGVALVAARIWIGRGGALSAAVFFLVVRGLLSLIVGPVLGETTPSLPLYLGSALCVEAAALAFAPRRRPLAFGAVAGALVGTAGTASEWLWTQGVMPLPWTGDLLPEAIVLAVAGGTAGGVIGALLGRGLRGELPARTLARPATAGAAAVIAACIAYGLVTTEPSGVRAQVRLERDGQATVRIDPPSYAKDPAWLTVTAWQGGGLHVDRLRELAPGVFRTSEPIPTSGDWKSIVRLHDGSALLGSPVYLPEDSAIPAREVPARASSSRPFVRDSEILQRERKRDAPGWLWAVASATVLALYLVFLSALAWGVGRFSGDTARDESSPDALRRLPRARAAPARGGWRSA